MCVCTCSCLCDMHLWVCMCAHSCAIAGLVRSSVSHLTWPGLPRGRPGLGEGSWGLCVGSGPHEVGALRETRETPRFSREPTSSHPSQTGCLGNPGVALAMLLALGGQSNIHLFWGLDPGGNTPLGVLR